MHRFPALSSVRCLGCGTVYAKPAGHGTAQSNPGCPKCGYVGWLHDEDRVREEIGRFRFDADLQPRRYRQSS
jgi:predicted  nucleic acid-binding Zn-ribbon protein